jgi:perosamine synthetase
MSDVTAAIGLAQVERLDGILERRAAVAGRYGELLGGLDGVTPLAADDADHRRSWFVYAVRLAPEIDREAVIGHLAGLGIGTARYLPSIHLQPYMRERYGYAEGMLPASEAASREHLAIPFHTALSQGEQETVVAALAEALARQ